MQKWEYILIFTLGNSVIYAGSETYATLKGKDRGGYEIKLEKGLKAPPHLYTILNKLGQEGWEVVGVVPEDSPGQWWATFTHKLILKRPSPD